MAWLLDNHLHYAISGGQGTFLDLPAQRYFALPPRDDIAFQEWLSEPSRSLANSNRGAFFPPSLRAIQVVAPVPIVLPREALKPDARFDLGLIARLWIAERSATWALRHSSLAKIAARLDAVSSDWIVDEGGLTNIAASAVWLNRFRTSFDQCLPRSLAVTLMCHRRRLEATLVIGVMARPFCAHAWVQSGSTVLNDDLEHIRHYSPIAAWPCPIPAI